MIPENSTKDRKNKTPYNWVAHSLVNLKFKQRIVKDKKKTYNRKKEKRIDY
jgi:hypothetical protein